MFYRSKGISSVVSTVLILSITVAGTGTAYMMIQSFTQESAELSFEEVQETDLKITSGTSDNDNLVLNVENVGGRAVNISNYKLMFSPNIDSSPVDYKVFEKRYPNIVKLGNSYRFEQGGETYYIDPYKGTESGEEWYPDTNNKLADSPIENAENSFAVTIYRETDASIPNLVFSNQNSDEAGRAKIDLSDVPEGAKVVVSDGEDGEGPVPHNHDELSLEHEPEGNWGWIQAEDCCYDGGVLELPDDWENITIDPVDVEPNLHLYEEGDGSIDVNDTEEIRLFKFQGNQCFDEDSEDKVLDTGESYSCFTGLRMPENRDVVMTISMKSNSKNWLYRCKPHSKYRIC